MAQDEIERARAVVQEARAALSRAWAAWAAAQGKHLRESLLEEGKLTATNQPEVTVKLGDDVRALRAELTELAERHGKALEDWGRDLKKLPTQSETDVWGAAVQRARHEFGALFHGRGYRATDGTSRSWTDGEGWEFYVPATGTARVRHLRPGGEGTAERSAAERAFAEAVRNLRALEALAAKRAAEDLWED